MKRGLITVLMLLIFFGANAQDEQQPNENPKTQKPKLPCMTGHYLTAEGGLGIQGMNYDLLVPGDVNSDVFGFDVKAGYRYYFHPNFGVGFGLRFQSYGAEAKVNYVQEISGVLDYYTPPREYLHRTFYNDYVEKQNVVMTEIPIEWFMQFSLARRLKLNIGLGLQANLFNITNNYKNSSGEISTHAYYDEIHLDAYDLPRYSLYDTSGFRGHYKYDVTVSAIGEIGLLYALNSRLELAMNFTGTYGLIKAMKNYSGKHIFDPGCELQDDETFPSYEPAYNAVLTTQAKDVKFVSMGVTFGIRFRMSKKDPTVALEFDEALGKARRLKETEDEDLNLMEALEDDEIERRRRKQDTIELAEKERQHRQVEDEEFYITPQGDTVWNKKPEVDSLKQVVVEEPKDTVKVIEEPKDTVKVVEEPKDTVKVVEEPKEEVVIVEKDITGELNNLIKNLNTNACEFNQTNPKNRKKQFSDIDKLANLLKENPDVILEAVGHTCDIGSVEANKEVGMHRAEYIKAELVSRGVPEKQIRCTTKWFTEPLVPNTSESNRMKNRRYELKIIKK